MKYIGIIFLFLFASCEATDPPISEGDPSDNFVDVIDEEKKPAEPNVEIVIDTNEEEIEIEMPVARSCKTKADCNDDENCKFMPAAMGSFCEEKNGAQNGVACETGDECSSGVCVNEMCADLCNDDCGVGFTCASEDFITSNGDIEMFICKPEAKRCLSTTDCPDGLVCLLGTNAKFECQPGSGAAVGEACEDNLECATNLCFSDVCAELCQRPTDCSDDGSRICVSKTVMTNGGLTAVNICSDRPPSQCLTNKDCANPKRCVATKTEIYVGFTCGSPNQNGKNSGESCSTDLDCDSNLCVNDICAGPCQGNDDCDADDATCNLVNVQTLNGDTRSVQICTPPLSCDDNSKCRINETCFVREETVQTDIFCKVPNVGGGSLGQQCSIPLECASNYCLTSRLADFCSEVCNDDSDCNLTGYTCQPFTFRDGSRAQMCQLAPPTSCDSQSDCAAGTNCSYVENTAGTAIETICIPSKGDAAGTACQSNDDCANGLCSEGFCSAPCTDSSQCRATQLCGVENVKIGTINDSVSLCQVPAADEACTNSSECTGARVCSVRGDGNGGLEPFCAFPNTNGAPMGSQCSALGDCQENICLIGISDTCSVVCSDDGDCSNGLGCTTYGGVGFCNSTCTDNDDCGAGQICTLNADTLSNDIDFVCQTADANGAELGANCTSGSDCQTGLCLPTIDFSQTACTTNANCSNGQTCECPRGQPNCTSGKFCAVQQRLCTNLCDDVSDCSSAGGNPLTSCAIRVAVPLPNGQGNKPLSTCTRP